MQRREKKRKTPIIQRKRQKRTKDREILDMRADTYYKTVKHMRGLLKLNKERSAGKKGKGKVPCACVPVLCVSC
jgi:hypothetical protein